MNPMPGPAREPAEISKLKGGKNAERAEHSLQMDFEIPDPPPHLTQAVREIWDYYVAILSKHRVLSFGDRDALHALCEAVHVHRVASMELEAEGLTVMGANGGTVKNPTAQVQRDAANAIRALCREFGLTPASRAAIMMNTGGKDKPSNDGSDLLT
jgi:P27 family predicted phage terminase small subunit